MTSKLRIRIGEVEIDYEGTEEFLKQELPQLLKTAMELHKASESPPEATGGKGASKGSGSGGRAGAGARLALTTASIAAKLDAKSGPDLLLAAVAHLVLAKATQPFSRQQLLTEMQTAQSYYKKSYSNNLSKYISAALQKDGPLSETGANAYALKASAEKALEAQLADN